MRTWLRRTTLSMLAAGTFTVALVTSAIVHLELPVARRAIEGGAKAAVAGFPAKTSEVAIGSIERTPSAIVFHDADLFFTDEAGRPALAVRGASWRVGYVQLVKQWIATGAVTLALDGAHVRSIDMTLDDDGQGSPRIKRAFVDPKKPAKPDKPTSDAPSSFTLVVDSLVVEHIWVHGVLAGTLFDADVDELHAALFMRDDMRVHLEDADVTARALPRPLRLRARAVIAIPAKSPMELAADVDGRFGEASAHARTQGTLERLDAVAFAAQNGGTADVVTSVWLADALAPMRAVVFARTRQVPLTIASPDAPAGTVSVNALATLTVDNEVGGTAWVRSFPTTIAGQRIPEIVAKASGRGKAWRVDARALDDGLDALLGADIDDSLVHAEAFVALPDLSHIGPLPPTPVHGRAMARVAVQGDFVKKNLDAAISAVAWGVSAGPGRADVVEVGGTVNWRGDSGIADAAANVRRGGARIDLDARAVHFGTGGVTSGAAGLRVGRGRVDASFRSSAGGAMANATVKDLRASDLQPFVTAAFPIREAVLGGAADVRSEGGVLHGSVNARVDGLAVTVADEKFEDAVVVLNAKLDDHDASYLASVILDGEAALNVSSEHVHVPALATDRASLLAITGRTQIDANATFACLHTWFGDRVPSTAGQAEVRLVYEHYGDGPHLASFEVQTTGAEIETPENGDIRGIDALAGGIVSLDDAHADLGASLTDRLGALVLVRIGSAFDAPVWNTAAMSDIDRWKRTPATVHVEVPDRDIATLPSQVRPTELHGRIAATLDITGSALAPTAAFSVDERGARQSSRKGDPLLDLHVDGTYDQKLLAATLATRGARATSLDGEVKLLLPWTDVLTGKAGDTWEASAVVRAEKLALGSIAGWFTKTPFAGTVSGVVNVGGLHREALAGVDLTLDQVAIGTRQVGSGHVVALLSGGLAAANVDLVQKMGRLDLAVGGKAQWGASLAPSLDLVDGVDGYLRAKAFDVSFVRPFVRELLPGFNAVIDSAMAFHVTSDMKASHVVGMMMLSGGRAEVAALGDELKDVRVRVDMAKDGKAKISQVEIYPATGRINADGEAVFDGLEFKSALLHLRIPRDAEIPVGMEGMPIGELQGNVDVALKYDAKGIGIGVTIPSLHLLLAPALGRNVQSLEPDPHIRVGTHTLWADLASGTPLPGAPASSSIPVHVDVSLGDDVWVKRQSDLQARITGKVAIDLGAQLQLAGAVSVPEGWVEIQGRRFSVERARVTFDGRPPSDPVIMATARYDAPGGVKIFADYVGAVSNGRVFLRSEPSMAANEIVSTIVFGSPTAQPGASSGSGNGGLQAAALGGGFATQGLNRALDDISPLDVSTRVDTTSSSNPRPELTLRVTKNVSVTLGVNLGTPSPGQPPDRTILRLEYQFRPNWRVRSTDGDKGSSILDFIWNYQY